MSTTIMSVTSMKIESDTVFCMICIAAFIGYTLGLQHAAAGVGAGAGVSSAMKAQESKKVNKFTQTNISLSDLKKLFISNNLIHIDSPILAHTKMHPGLDPGVVEKDPTSNDVAGNDDVTGTSNNEQARDTSEPTPNVESKDEKNKVIINNSEEDYEVILENIKKVDVKKPQYYFGWFDSIF